MRKCDKNDVSLWTRLCMALLVAVVFLGCASRSYEVVSPSAVGRIQELSAGTVIAVKEVQIDGEKTFTGTSSGAIIGTAIGQTAGSGSGQVLAAAGGAAVGGIVGGMVEKELTKKKAQELTISVDDGETVVVVQVLRDPAFIEGDRVRVLHTPTGDARVSHAQYESDGLYWVARQ